MPFTVVHQENDFYRPLLFDDSIKPDLLMVSIDEIPSNELRFVSSPRGDVDALTGDAAAMSGRRRKAVCPRVRARSICPNGVTGCSMMWHVAIRVMRNIRTRPSQPFRPVKCLRTLSRREICGHPARCGRWRCFTVLRVVTTSPFWNRPLRASRLHDFRSGKSGAVLWHRPVPRPELVLEARPPSPRW